MFDTKRKANISKRLEKERLHRIFNPSTRSKQRTYELKRRAINLNKRKTYREQYNREIHE